MGTGGQHASAEKPLQGAVLCCTSIASEERQVIADLAEQMGAEHELDLTSRVTHLLVGESGSEKYRFVAKNREDVKVLLPAWVQAVRERWIADEPLDMNALEAQYKVPPLYGLKICITGFEDYSFRNQLQKNIEENGAIYTGELTRENTHLIAAVAEGKKYEYANLWRLQIVSLKWYQDTLRRGMQLDETKYHPSLPAEQQGLGAWIRPAADATLGKRQREDGPTREASRKLRRTASARLGSQSDTIWSEIGRHSTDDIPPPYELLRSSKSLPNLQVEINDLSELSETSEQLAETEKQPCVRTGFLTGCHFIVRGFDAKKLEKVHDVLQGHGGELHKSLKELLAEQRPNTKKYILVYHEVDRTKLRGLDEAAGKAEVVTELWLEWCMMIKEAVSIADYPLGGIMQRIQVPQASALVVNATGFQGIQTSHVSKVLARLGITYDETFTSKTNVLICCSFGINAQKIIHAKQWQIPIVSDKWLWRLLSDQRIPSFEPFLLYNSRCQTPTTRAIHEDKPIPTLKSVKALSEDHKPSRKLHGVDDDIPIHQDLDDATAHPADHDSTPYPDTTLDDMRIPNVNANMNDSGKTPLQEISSNLSPRRLPSPKKKLFRTFDGADSKSSTPAAIEPEPCDSDVQSQAASSRPPPKEHSDLVAEFLHLKAIAHAKAEQPKHKSKKLLSRALSNVSNSSRTSTKEEKQLPGHKVFSRTSSINSINTDGLGAELSSSTRPVAKSSLDELFAVRPSAAAVDLSDPNLCRDVELDPSQQASQKQVTYEDSADAIALKAKLAEKRRARGRLDPDMGNTEREKTGEELTLEKLKDRERNIIRDDEIALGNAERRVTRGREKLLEELGRRNPFFD